MSKLLNWKFFGIILLAGIIGTGYYALKYDNAMSVIDANEQKIEQLNNKVSRLVSTIDTMEQDITEQINKNHRLDETITNLQKEKQKYIEDLEKAKGRQELVWRYPSIVQRYFRKNWKARTDAMSCAMGVLEKCQDSSNTSSE
tara:strand:- start:816 stop:1244 length:429 start_codon:yes stop_codon:yes gene_type:complete